ncbi:MAG: hypothetical protein HYU59_04955 [Magnetospirillum gryphiswaldense]|nr:hypothetical protein [Magnetospirillum gryphiswaldense]
MLLHLARGHGAGILGRHRLAQLVGQDEGRLVLDVEIATQLEDRNRRGFRGGSWQGSAKEARSAFRAFARHDARMNKAGFRLARDMAAAP